MQKMTIADKFDEVVKALDGVETVMTKEELVDFIYDRKEKAQKKASNRKPTATQKENEGIKDTILGVLSTEGKTVSEVMASDDALAGLSNQKVSALLRQLVLAEKVVKTKDGKRTLFSVAE